MSKSYLLDSHIFLWLLQEPQKLGPETRRILQDEELWISIATLWELTLKYHKQKLKFSPAELLVGVRQVDADLLAIKPSHIAVLGEFEFEHKDPFDMMLAAQSKAENIWLITADQALLSQDLVFVINAKK